MPDNMSPESSSVDRMRSLGQPVQLPGAEETARYARLVNEEHSQWKDLNPNDPNYDQRLDAQLMGALGHERFGGYERDPLGLYSAGNNLAETMLKYGNLAVLGSSQYKTEAQAYILARERGAGSGRNAQAPTSADKAMWEKEATEELLRNEASTLKELDRNFRLAVASGNRSLNETLMMLEAFVPPKPFEANMQERNFSTSRQATEAIATYFDGTLPERIGGWYRAFDATNEQQFALFNILCAAGGGLEGYYDALKQAGETLISRSRYHANVVDFRAAYTNDDPGVSTYKLTNEENAHIKDTLASREIRETQVEMLSQARRLIIFNVDVAQFDLDKPVGEEGLMRLNPAKIQEKQDALNQKINELRAKGKNDEANRVQKHVDSLEGVKHLNLENHREFMRLVFGEIDKSKWIKWKSPDTGREVTTPRETLTWYASSDKVEDREKWLSKMMAVLTWKENGKSLSDFLETASEAEILRVAKEVSEKAEYIKSNIGDKIMNSNLEFAAAKIALVSWIEQDKAFQTSGQLAWMYKYKEFQEKDAAGNVTRSWNERLYDAGGLYKAFDSINLHAYWRKWVSYKATLKSTTTFVGPASDSWRREVSKHGPDWLPPLDRMDANPKIKKIHDRFFKDTPAMMLWRAQRLTGNNKLTVVEMRDMITSGKLKDPKIDDFMKKKLLETGWTFESAYDVPIPMYMPKTFKINLWEMMQDKSTKEAVWDLYSMGIMPKDVDWNNYNYETIDRMWVSMSMLTRFAKFFVDTYETQRDPQYQAFFGEPGVQSIAEMSKRVYLAFRDLPKDPGTTSEKYQQYILAIVPFMIVQNTASEVGLTSTDLGSAGAKEKVIKRWNFVMSKWIRAAMWTPQVILDDGQLYDGANQDIQSLRNDIALMIMYYKHIFEKVAQAAYKSDIGKLSRVYDDQKSIYGVSLKDEMSAEPGEATFNYGQEKIVEPFSDGEKAVEALLFGERR